MIVLSLLIASAGAASAARTAALGANASLAAPALPVAAVPVPGATIYPVAMEFPVGKLETDLLAPAPVDGRVDLSEIDPAATHDLREKESTAKLAKDQLKLDQYQQMLFADHKKRILVMLQAMDTGGKDGTIRHVMRSLNPAGVVVTSFKKPTAEEVKHGYRWRIEKALPGPGMIGIHNRSIYEDVLVPTVRKTLPPDRIEARYAEINEFEKKLAAEGYTILKFFLYISKDEQKHRLQERLDNPNKNWKFSVEDLKSRAIWKDIMSAYETVLAKTNTPWAPWYVIPANHKWFRDFAVGRIIRRAMKAMDLHYPPPPPDLPKTIPD